MNQQEQEPQRGIEEILNPKTNTTKEEIAPNSEMDAFVKVNRRTIHTLIKEASEGKYHDKDGKQLSAYFIKINGGKLAQTTYYNLLNS